MSYKDIAGWFDFEVAYGDAVREAPQGATLVEVGVAFGRSIAFLARQAIDQGRNDLTIIGVDQWLLDGPHPDPLVDRLLDSYGRDFAAACRGELARWAPEELARVDLWHSTSIDAAARMTASGVRPAFVWIDADHSYEGIRSDLDLWHPLMAEHGVIGGHDYGPQFMGIVRAVMETFGAHAALPPSSWRVRL